MIGTGRSDAAVADAVRAAARDVVAAVSEGAEGRSREEWLALAGACQDVVNTMTAAQDVAVAEAARMGLPLVLSDIPTFRELWSDAALFFPPREAEALTAILDELASDPAERRRLGEAAQLRSRHFTPEAQARAMLALYADLVRQPLPTR